MDEATILAGLRRHWEYEITDIDLSHEIYHDDAVLEFPQSRERFEAPWRAEWKDESSG